LVASPEVMQTFTVVFFVFQNQWTEVIMTLYGFKVKSEILLFRLGLVRSAACRVVHTDIGMQQPMIASDHPATANVAVFVDDLTVLYLGEQRKLRTLT